MRRAQFSIRVLVFLTLVVAIGLPSVVFMFPRALSYFSTTNQKIEFPDIEQWERDFDAARLDRSERANRLRNGTDTVDDAMKRFAAHDFLRPEKLQGISGWIMTTDSGARIHRATLQRQSRLFDCLGDNAVPQLVKWLQHEQAEIRYIASFALERATGLSPDFPHFATLKQLNEESWLADTTAEYENWLLIKHEAEIAR